MRGDQYVRGQEAVVEQGGDGEEVQEDKGEGEVGVPVQAVQPDREWSGVKDDHPLVIVHQHDRG